MLTALIVSNILLWLLVLFLGFLLLGTLRVQSLLNWKLEEFEATTPNRVGRTGLKPGKSAPEFTLPQVDGKEIHLRDLEGHPALLVFVQSGCGPCHTIVPELNKLADQNDLKVLVIINAEPEVAREWAEDVKARFPVLIQEKWRVSKSFEVYATPFAFLLDSKGVVRSAGIVNTPQYLSFVLSRAAERDETHDHAHSGRPEVGSTPSKDLVLSKELAND